MKKNLLALLVFCVLGLASDGWAADADAYYDLHIIAVDRDGSAMRPGVRQEKGKFKAKPKRMDGELLEAKFSPGVGEPPVFRQEYYEYVSRILEEIRRVKPKRVVFYVHGGMNFITGAIAKGAQLAEDMRGREKEEYRISICWSSNLFSTYQEHLAGNVEGLSSPGMGLLTAPLTLVSDVGSALADAPRTLVRLFTNDVNAANPWASSRYRRALARMTELEAKPELHMGEGMRASLAIDGRANRKDAVAMDVAAWVATKPAKIATAPLIDQLGGGAWQMMLRRTRTMFERESSIITRYFERDPALRELNRIGIVDGELVRAHPLTREQLAFNERAAYAGRIGAVRLFFEQAEAFLVSQRSGGKYRPEVVLIGHSMGTIVINEILARFINLDFDHIVFMAAACTVNDFARVGVPYLRQHPRARFYNLCLNPAAERSEAQPGKLMLADPVYLPLEIAPRGSLLVWIDSFLDHPASEGDRTLGRWENAVLVADAVPMNILGRMTLKGFGRDRSAGKNPGHAYTANIPYRAIKSGGLNRREYLAEPREHGDFSRSRQPDAAAKPNFAFTEKRYWEPEKKRAAISKPRK